MAPTLVGAGAARHFTRMASGRPNVYLCSGGFDSLRHQIAGGTQMKGFLSFLLLVVLFAVAYLLLWPVTIDPAAWTPPANPGWTGTYAKNQRLAGIERLAGGAGIGPEAVVVGKDGRVYSGYIDGRLVAVDPASGKLEALENTGGRPLGVQFGPAGELYVADAVRGLMVRHTSGELEVLSNNYQGERLGFVDDLDLDRQGRIYFSDASSKFGVTEVRADFFEHRGNGALLRYDPATGITEQLAGDLYFPNGIAVGPDDEYVLVNETAKYRVMRYWLKGDKAGQLEPFIDNLPGFPDNITYNGNGTYWLALYGPSSADLDALMPRPFLRKVVYRLPQWLQPSPAHDALVLGLNLEGEVIANYQYRGEDAYAPITSVREHDGWLYLGSLSADAIGRIRLPEAGS